MSDIFISYAREEKPFVGRLAAALEAEGLSVWWDPEIPTGRRYRRVIQEALDRARCVIVVWSRDSVDSDWVLAESGEGLRRNLLAPVAVDGTPPPLEYRQIQTADLSGWQGEGSAPEFRKLLADVRAILGAPASDRVPVVPPQPPPPPWWRRRGVLVAGLGLAAIAVAAIVIGVGTGRGDGQPDNPLGVDDAIWEELKRSASPSGRAVLVMPYRATSDDVAPSLAGFNQNLPANLHEGILTRLQSLGVGVPLHDVGIDRWPAQAEVESSNTEKVRRVGNELNVMAVVSGRVRPAADGAGRVAVSSTYQIIPGVDEFVPLPVFLDDECGVDELPETLFSQLPDAWTLSTALALAVRETQEALEQQDTARLDRARSLLVAARAQAAADEPLLAQLNALKDLLDRKLGS